jgi:transcriptional regulator NrdR family protein
MYKVQKKDGVLEDFDRTKIVNGLIKAGATEEEAEKVASEIDAWLRLLQQIMSSTLI